MTEAAPPESKLHFGLRIETQALAWYQARTPAARVLARNFRWRGGEIDFVLEEPSGQWPGRTELVFVEVRARLEGAWVDGVESITGRKLGRLRRGVGVYLARYRGSARGARLDVLAWDGETWEHLRDAAPLA